MEKSQKDFWLFISYSIQWQVCLKLSGTYIEVTYQKLKFISVT